MKTHFFLMSTVVVLGASLLSTSYAASSSEYLHFTRHRDSNGNLLMAPPQHHAEASVMQKTVMPSQPQMFERRTTDWGMSVQDVKENEPVQSSWDLRSPVLADYEQRVAYHTQIEGIEAALTYTFYDNHLGQAKYVFEPQHEDAVEFVQDFQTVKHWISDSYGLPTSVQEIWLDTLYQYDSSLWGQALKRGHLVMVAEWKNPGTDIVLMLDGGDDSVGLVADFSSTTFVVPVSFDPQSAEENVEAAVEDSIQKDEALPLEPAAESSVEGLSGQDITHEDGVESELQPETEVASKGSVGGTEQLEEIEEILHSDHSLPLEPEDSSVEELSGQDMTRENEVSGAMQLESEVASKGPAHDVDELDEIEEMLREEYPLSKPSEPVLEEGLVDGGIDDSVSENTAIEVTSENHVSVNSEELNHAVVDKNPMSEEHMMGERMMEDHLVEPSVDVQEPVMDMSNTMPLESSLEGSTTDAHSADTSSIEGQAITHDAMDAEVELDPQHL